MLETFLRNFGPYWHDSITQLLQICWLHPWCGSPVPPHPKGALLDWDLVTVEAIWVKWRRRIFYLSHTQYNQQWNVFSAFNPSKCTHTWSSGQPTLRRPGSSWRFSALLKGLTSVVDNSCRSRDSNPQPQITSPTLYPLGHNCYTVTYCQHICCI